VALDEDTALPTLALAVYLNMSHLVSLVSHYIVAHLRAQDLPLAVESAAQLHIFASEHGLDALCRFCAAFLSVHITEARKAPSYKLLGAKQLGEVCVLLQTLFCFSLFHSISLLLRSVRIGSPGIVFVLRVALATHSVDKEGVLALCVGPWANLFCFFWQHFYNGFMS
jgi:hypothetical protein